MKKYIRKWVKDEKRLVKLFFQKGFMDKNCPPISELYWEEFRHGNRQRRRNGKVYVFYDYLPEIHYGTCDYWGEYDDHALIPEMIEGIRWANLVTEPDYELNGGWGTSNFDGKSRAWFIKYLKTLPTVNRSSAINRILKRTHN